VRGPLAVCLLAVLLAPSAFAAADGAGAATAGGSIEPFILTHSEMFPAEHPFGQLAAAWAAEVERASGGLVKIDIAFGGSLTSPQECIDGVLQGTSDLCHTALAYTPHRFPVMEAADLPGYSSLGNTARLTTAVANELYRTFQPDEFAGMRVLYLHAHPPGAFTSVSEPIDRIADFAGLRIRSTGLSAQIAAILGAEPVLLPATQTYELLRTGQVDMTMSTLESLKYNRFADAAGYTTIAPELGYVTTFALVIRREVWDGLPAEVQEAIASVSALFDERAAALWDRISLEGYQYALEQGHEFVTLPPSEVREWSRAVQRAVERAYVERLEPLGIDGWEVLARRWAEIAAHLGEFPPLDLDPTYP